MASKKTKNWVIILLIFPLGLLLNNCGVKDTCYYYHQVTFPISISAKSDTINIGDTVKIDMAFSRTLKEELTEDYLFLPEEFIDHYISIVKIDRDYVDLISTYSTGGVSSFDTLSLVGQLSYDFINFNRHFRYKITSDSVFGSFRFIAKDTGTFVFDLVDAAYYRFQGSLRKQGITLCNTECNEQYWHGFMKNLNTNNNYYIIQKRHVYFDTTRFHYFDQTVPYNPTDPNHKNNVNDFKKNLQYGTFSVVVKDGLK